MSDFNDLNSRPAQSVARVNNPFAAQGGNDVHMPQSYGASNSVDQVRAIAEVQAAMAIARANPRDPVVAMDRILNACSRPSLAETAMYVYARGGQNIQGPSIRLAEVLAQNWGNIQYGVRELSATGGVSEMQAYAWDVETNTKREIVFSVAHKRFTKRGAYDLQDSRDIYELTANQGARRLRTCILSLIPGDVVEQAVRQCQLTLQTNVDCSPEKVKVLLNAFADFGVSKAMIEARIQRRIESIAPGQIITLRNIYASLKDGMGVVGDYFDVTAAAGVPTTEDKAPAAIANNGGADALLSAINQAAAEVVPTAPAPTPETVPAAPTEPRQRSSKNTRAVFERISNRIAELGNGGEVDPVAVTNEINSSELTAEERKELSKQLGDAVASLS